MCTGRVCQPWISGSDARPAVHFRGDLLRAQAVRALEPRGAFAATIVFLSKK